MKKSNLKTLAILGILGIAGYFVWKYLSGNKSSNGGGGGWWTDLPTLPTLPTMPTVPTPQQKHQQAGSRQAFTGPTAVYGAPGQPSIKFAINTLKEGLPYVSGIGKAVPAVVARNIIGTTFIIAKPIAVSQGIKPLTIIKPTIAQSQASLAAQAILAGAPPRMVAKIKAGKVW